MKEKFKQNLLYFLFGFFLSTGALATLFSLEFVLVKASFQRPPLTNQDVNLMNSGFSASYQANFLPIRNWQLPPLEIGASSVIVYDIQAKKILFAKNPQKRLPIASLTKLMTAMVILDNLSETTPVLITPKAVAAYGNAGGLVQGESLSVGDLLKIMLIQSSNDAAVALAEKLGEKKTVSFMNKKAKEIGMWNTFFSEPTGIAASDSSTAEDIAKMVLYSQKYPLLWKIMATPSAVVFSLNRKHKHFVINTDKLLGKGNLLVAGKTGYTEKAGQCFLATYQNLKGHKIIFVILNSQDRFSDFLKILKWLNQAYKWL